MAPEQSQLVDVIRKLDAREEGKQLERCYCLGQTEQARVHLRKMNALTKARIAARTAGCYFVEQGEAARAAAEEVKS